jgi:hypothetical protein
MRFFHFAHAGQACLAYNFFGAFFLDHSHHTQYQKGNGNRTCKKTPQLHTAPVPLRFNAMEDKSMTIINHPSRCY